MKNIILSALYLIILFSISQFIFDPTHLYYEIKWLDIPMHILGGLGVAALTASLLAYNGVKVSFWKLFVAYIVVAIIWEAYEYIHDMLLGRVWNGWFDTIKDTIDGFIGMSVLYLFAKR